MKEVALRAPIFPLFAKHQRGWQHTPAPAPPPGRRLGLRSCFFPQARGNHPRRVRCWAKSFPSHDHLSCLESIFLYRPPPRRVPDQISKRKISNQNIEATYRNRNKSKFLNIEAAKYRVVIYRKYKISREKNRVLQYRTQNIEAAKH